MLALFSCNVTKKVPSGGYLLTKNRVIINDNEVNNQDVTKYILQRPNSKFLGIPLGLHLYNLAGENSQARYNMWLEDNKKTAIFLEKLLSKKQVVRLGESFLISGKDKLLKKLGQEPAIVDSVKVIKTSNTLKSYLNSIGYFNASSSFEVVAENAFKRARVDYKLTTGRQYYIDSVYHKISSKQLDSLYNKHIGERVFNPKDKYNLSLFVKERDRLTELFRENGFYNFQQNAISYKIERDTISDSEDSLVNVWTKIDDFVDRTNEESVTKPYLMHKFDKVSIHIEEDSELPYDSIAYKDITIFYKDKLRFKPKVLYNSIDFYPSALYSDKSRLATMRQISNMRTFRYPNIQYTNTGQRGNYEILDANIRLSPLPRFSFQTNMEVSYSDIQALGIGGSLSLLSRNVFRGAETLEFTIRGTIGSQRFLVNDAFFNVSEYGGDIRLTIPRIWLFSPFDIIPIGKTPQTVFQLGTTIQQNIGLDKEKLQAVLRYNWNPKIKDKIGVDLFDVEYVKNKNPDNFFSVYSSSYNFLNNLAKKYYPDAPYLKETGNLKRKGGPEIFIQDAIEKSFPMTLQESLAILNLFQRYSRLTENNLTVASSVTYINNNSIKYSEPNFQQYRIKLETAGNIPNLISVIEKNNQVNGEKTLFGVKYAQYVKTEFEYIKHWDLGYENIFAIRMFAGFAIPYGNGKSIPFNRSYFAGGSNDNRGWRAYSLGPGKSSPVFEFNEANLKITTNLEHRFKIRGALKGAFFLDAGNIWYAFNSDGISDEDWKFDSIKDLRDLAVSSGFGLRYDFNFFTIRTDFGMKTYDPSQQKENKWFSGYRKLSNVLLNVGINYPF